MLARMNFSAALTQNQRFNIAAAARGKGPTPEALLSFYLDQLTRRATTVARPTTICWPTCSAGVTWNGSDAQLAMKAPGFCT